MKFSLEIRKAVYRANAIELMNYHLQRNMKTGQSFPNDAATMKLIVMVLKRIAKKRTLPLRNGGKALITESVSRYAILPFT